MPHQPIRPAIELLSERPAAKIDTTLVGLTKAQINKKLADREKRKKKDNVNNMVQEVADKANKKKPQKKAEVYIMRPVVVPPAVVEKEYSSTIYSQVPAVVEFPTLGLAPSIPGVAGVPWSAAPVGYAIPLLVTSIGVLLIKRAGVLLAALAMETVVGLAEMGLTKARDVQIQLHTGAGTGERWPGFTEDTQKWRTSKDYNAEWDKATDWTV